MILVIDNNTRYLHRIQSMLKRYGCSFKAVKIKNVKTSQLKAADAVILTGGPSIPDLDKKILEKEIKLIKGIEKPLFGICLGFELICRAYGAEIIQLPEKIRGIMKIRIMRKDDIFMGCKKISVYENHRYCVKKAGRLVVLAASEKGIEAVKHPVRPVYGVQFHPEMRRSNQGYRCFENFLKAVNHEA